MLSQLTEVDEEKVESRLLEDADYAEEFDIIVTELTDEYARGEFQPEEREQFEQYFFKSEDRKAKLRFALTLKQRSEGVVDGSRKSRLTFYLPIAAGLILALGLGFGIWRVYFTKSDVDQGLLALQTAFNKERTIEARLSDFTYAPVANQRGGPTKVDYVQRDLAASHLLNAVSKDPSPEAHRALGLYYLTGNEFDKAIDQFQAALVLNPNIAKTHNDFGVALMEKGRLASQGPEKGKEIELFGKSLEQFNKAVVLDGTLLEAKFNRALLFQHMMLPQQAISAWKEYLQKDANSRWADEARRNLKLLEDNAKQNSWNTGDGVRTFEEARRNGDDEAAWKVLTQTYTSRGNEVANSLLDSLFGLEVGSGSTQAGDNLPAFSYLAKLEFDRAGDRYDSELVKNYEHVNPKLQPVLADARKHMKLGYSLFTQSQFSDAIGEYNAAKVDYERAGDTISKSFVDYRQAHCYVLLPDLNKAEAAFKTLLATSEARGYHWLVAQCFYGLAHVSAARNDYSKSVEFSTRALAILEQVGDLNGVLKCMSQLADLNQSLNQIAKSLSYVSRGLALSGEIRAEPMQRWGMLVQGAYNMSSMELHSAELYFHKEALEVALEMQRPLIISRSHGYVGSAYAKLERYPEAVIEATKAFDAGRSISETGGLEIMANASMQLGDIHRQANECDKAIADYDTSIALYSNMNLEYYSYAAHKGKLLCVISGPDVGTAREELQTVLGLSELYRSKITAESDRITFFELEQGVYDLAIDFEFSRMKDPIKAFEYSEQSRARALLDRVRRGAKDQAKGDGADLKLQSVANSLSLDELKAQLPNGSQIIQYAVLDDKLLIWVVSSSGVYSQEVAIGSQLLAEKVRIYLGSVNTPPPNDGDNYSESAKELYRILVAPVESHLDKSKYLCIVPDKILHYLPYRALISPSTTRYLIEDYDVGVAPSSSLFAALSAVAEKKTGAFDERLLSVGNPRFDQAAFSSLPDLPAAAREAQAVAAFYKKRRILLPNDARETTFKSEIESADVAHLAMHFVINEQSEMLSGFPMVPDHSGSSGPTANGFLQSFEIYAMKLPRTRLVVLAACQTGIEQHYRGEGAISVARPFLVAGVPIVVASLWPVDSDASERLMTDFHQQRIRSRLAVTKALSKAQIEMAYGSDSRYRHPYYWAAFLAIGGQTAY